MWIPMRLKPESDRRWLEAFSPEERLNLLDELLRVLLVPSSESDRLRKVDEILHEWAESGWAALSPEVRAAHEATPDPKPLPRPQPEG